MISQVKDQTARPVPFKQERGSEEKSGHFTHSLEHESAFLATTSTSNLCSNLVSRQPVMKNSTRKKEADDDLTYQDILKLLQR